MDWRIFKRSTSLNSSNQGAPKHLLRQKSSIFQKWPFFGQIIQLWRPISQPSGQIWPNSRQAPVFPRQELSKKVKTVAVAQVKVLKIDGFTKSYNFSTFNGWNLLKNRPHAVRFWVAVIKTIAEVAHTIFSHIQVHKFGWKKFEHPKSILSTASKLLKMATFW